MNTNKNSKNLQVTYKIFEKCNYIHPKFIKYISIFKKIIKKKLSLDVKFIQDYLNLNDQFIRVKYIWQHVCFLKKTYKISKNYNKAHKNL